MQDNAQTTWAEAAEALSERTGVVVPVYLAPDHDAAVGRRLIEETTAAIRREVNRPEAICLSVDGPGAGVEVARDLAEKRGLTLVCGERNRGKLAAVRAGANVLLEDDRLRYFAVVDQDGDHFANELMNFVRAARHVEEAAQTERVIVLGRRISKHRPMGLVRGEMEDLADRILLDALRYHAVKCDKPLDLRFALTIEDVPDFHSGYKLFTRATAAEVFGPEPRYEDLPEECACRHAVESVLTVESLLAGATPAVINRCAVDEQPLSAFGLLDRPRLVADKIIWPCRRLRVPPAFVAQWMDDHLPVILLGTLLPEGRDELLMVRRLVREAFGLPDDRCEDIVRPPFI